MPVNRLPYLPLFIDDYLNDPAVLGMDADAEGCYCRLLFRSWRSNTPGVIFSGHVYEMAGLWRIAEQYRLLWDPKRWEQHPYGPSTPDVDEVAVERIKDVMKQLEAGFTVASDGFWTQKRMVAEYDRLSAKSAAHAFGAATTNKRKAQQQRARRAAKRDAKRPVGEALSGEEVEVDSDQLRSEKDSDSSPATSSGNGPGEPTVKPVRTRTGILTEAAANEIERMRQAGLIPKPPSDEEWFEPRRSK